MLYTFLSFFIAVLSQPYLLSLVLAPFQVDKLSTSLKFLLDLGVLLSVSFGFRNGRQWLIYDMHCRIICDLISVDSSANSQVDARCFSLLRYWSSVSFGFC